MWMVSSSGTTERGHCGFVYCWSNSNLLWFLKDGLHVTKEVHFFGLLRLWCSICRLDFYANETRIIVTPVIPWGKFFLNRKNAALLANKWQKFYSLRKQYQLMFQAKALTLICNKGTLLKMLNLIVCLGIVSRTFAAYWCSYYMLMSCCMFSLKFWFRSGFDLWS